MYSCTTKDPGTFKKKLKESREKCDGILRSCSGQRTMGCSQNTYPGTLAPLPVAPFLYVICNVAAADFFPALST